VISQAFTDASSDKRHNRVAVATWLLCKDFETVCDLASLNHLVIKKVLATILAETPDRGQVICKRLITTIENL